MIVEKKARIDIEKIDPPETNKSEPEEYTTDNGMIEAYKAVRKILEGIKENPDDPDSPRLFKTVKMDTGQLSRIKNNSVNREYGIAFPAVFIHFVDVYYNQGTASISEGRGTMRIHYILNRLNNGDDDFETEGMDVFRRIIKAIEENKSSFPALVSRFQLQYWDQPLTFDDGLQPYWIDYQIWFSDFTAYRYKNYVDAYVVSPPFTNHSDQNETANPDHLPDKTEPTFEECAGFETPGQG